MKNIICFLTVTPSNSFYNFAKDLLDDNYDVFICIDKNDYKIPGYDFKIPLIQLNNECCEKYGFKNTVMYFKDRACARDKALYYFSKKKINFNKLWLIEEDVFIPNTSIISTIDSKYPEADLLTNPNINTIHKLEDIKGWHWPKIINNIKLPLPWSCSMISACRISGALLECIEKYANYNKSLFLDEALFNTICIHNGLSVLGIEELKNITFREDWNVNNITKDYLYHPVKNTYLHTIFRKHFCIL
jgi:hypothetical protein